MILENTLNYIKTLHGDVLDYAGKPYWLHPIDVMINLPMEASKEDEIIALLHDVPEDCSGENWDRSKELIASYSPYIQRGVMLLTRIKGQFLHHETMEITSGTYMDYVENVIKSRHFGAIIVKLTDNQRNSDPQRIAKVPDAAKRAQLEAVAKGRYARSMALLQAELSHWNGRTRDALP